MLNSISEELKPVILPYSLSLFLFDQKKKNQFSFAGDRFEVGTVPSSSQRDIRGHLLEASGRDISS